MKWAIIHINCDCAGDTITVPASAPKRWQFGPRCPNCRRILGPMQWNLWDEIEASTAVAAYRIWREKVEKGTPNVAIPRGTGESG